MIDSIIINPTETRYVAVRHEQWPAEWAFQFPESIPSETGWAMDHQPVHPSWKQFGPNHWGYRWRTDTDYLRRQENYKKADAHQATKEFRIGLVLEAELEVQESALRLSLKLTNESDSEFRRVACDGGCFQARSPLFAGSDEVKRTYLRVDGQMKSMAELSRTVPIRCTYHSKPEDYDRPPGNDGEWFWGRSNVHPTEPVIVGMKSVVGRHAVVIGYEGATAASANADDHHCIHSRPWFGNIAPGKAVQRTGWILFGEDLDAMAGDLHRRLSSPG